MSSFYLIVKRGETSLRLGYSAQQVHIILFILSISLDKKSVKGQFFYHISFKNSVQTHIFNKTDALQNWYTMTLGRLYFVYVC